jgi:hypothetical protein
MKWTGAIAAAAMAAMLAPTVALADSSIGAVEGARAKERQGAYLSPQDRENLRRYGGNDDYGYGGYGYAPYYGGAYYGGDYDGYGYGPGVSIYFGY